MIHEFSFEALRLQGAYLIRPFCATDNRGTFIKDYSRSIFESNDIKHDLTEVFYTISHKGVIRALHFQSNNHQPKLVRCVRGKIFDVIVDLRPESPTFKQWLGFYLSGTNMNELYVPRHFAHGYLVLEESIVSYKCSADFDAKNDSGIKFDDADINIQWPFDEIDGIGNLIISEKDLKLQTFQEYLFSGCK